MQFALILKEDYKRSKYDKGDEMDALIYTSYGISAKANCVKT